MRHRASAALFALAIPLATLGPAAGAPDLSSSLQALGPVWPGNPSPPLVTVLRELHGRIHVFGVRDGTDQVPRFFDTAANQFVTDTISGSDHRIDAEKVNAAKVFYGNLSVSTEDERGDDNRSSGFLRTPRGWLRANVPEANAHQQAQHLYKGRWFGASALGAAPYIRHSDDFGKTWTLPPSAPVQFEYVHYFAAFFEFDGELFAKNNVGIFNAPWTPNPKDPEKNITLLHYTGLPDQPWEQVWRNEGPIFTDSFEIGGRLVVRSGTRLHATAGIQRTGVAGPYLAPDPTMPAITPAGRRVGGMAMKHGLLYVLEILDDGSAEAGRRHFIRATSDGIAWNELAEFTVNSSSPLAGFKAGEIEIAANGDFYIASEFDLFRIPRAALGAYAPPNQTPDAVGESYTVPAHTPLRRVRSWHAVMANDRDANSDSLKAELVTPPAAGALELRDDGSFIYTPPLFFEGDASFTYRISDGLAASSPVTASITVTPGPPPSLAMYGSITSFTGQQTGNEAFHAIDGVTADDDNRWSAEGFPQSLVIDLGKNREISEVRVHTYLNRAYRYLVEAKADGGGFETIVNRSGNTTPGSPITDTFPSRTARQVRITVTGASGYTGNWVSIREIEIFGPASPPLNHFIPGGPNGRVLSSEGSMLRIGFERGNLPGVRWIVEKSPSLLAGSWERVAELTGDGPWHPPGVVSETVPTGGVIRCETDLAREGTSQFIRLRAENPSPEQDGTAP